MLEIRVGGKSASPYSKLGLILVPDGDVLK